MDASTLVEKILELLQPKAGVTVDLLGAFLTSRSGSYRKYHRFLRHGPRQFKTDWSDWYRKRRQFFNTLNYLRREGLIIKNKKKNTSSWFITKRGKERFKLIRVRKKDPFSKKFTEFNALRGGGITIVAFDIPEQKRRARDWIRVCLGEMEFRMLQKSVWVSRGNVIDEDFIHALRERDLLEYVHIFSVNRRGTIRRV